MDLKPQPSRAFRLLSATRVHLLPLGIPSSESSPVMMGLIPSFSKVRRGHFFLSKCSKCGWWYLPGICSSRAGAESRRPVKDGDAFRTCAAAAEPRTSGELPSQSHRCPQISAPWRAGERLNGGFEDRNWELNSTSYAQVLFVDLPLHSLDLSPHCIKWGLRYFLCPTVYLSCLLRMQTLLGRDCPLLYSCMKPGTIRLWLRWGSPGDTTDKFITTN